MMTNGTKIRWTEETWNPTTGCSVVSPGCEHCYAQALSLRFGWSKKPWTAQNAKENVILHPERLSKPLTWKTPKRVFVDSMSDLFHELVPDEFLDRVFAVMEQCPQHTFQVLTKRPERMMWYMLRRYGEFPGDYANPWCSADPPQNVWLGTSIEDQRRANERIPLLLETPAAVRFLSCEPLLGEIDLPGEIYEACPGGCGCRWPNDADVHECGCDGGCCEGSWSDRQPRLHWLICGGESGPGYRFADGYLDAARWLRDQCASTGIAFFHKQSPGPRTEMGQELDGVRHEQFPATLARMLLPGGS